MLPAVTILGLASGASALSPANEDFSSYVQTAVQNAKSFGLVPESAPSVLAAREAFNNHRSLHGEEVTYWWATDVWAYPPSSTCQGDFTFRDAERVSNNGVTGCKDNGGSSSMVTCSNYGNAVYFDVWEYWNNNDCSGDFDKHEQTKVASQDQCNSYGPFGFREMQCFQSVDAVLKSDNGPDWGRT
jgi:hypothetical protein